MKPLFMWAGGKNKMLKKYAPHLPQRFDKYVEPFFGGGAMFIWARNKNPEAEFVINDNNESIVSIYREIKNNLVPFKVRLDELEGQYLPLDKPERKVWFYELRHEHAYDYEKWSKAEEAATLYFLMKTAFNGIWQINKNTDGRFGTPFGLGKQKDKVYDRDVLKWWHDALQNTTILCDDFEPVVRAHASKGSFVFMDPPYRDSFTQYNTDFNDEEQERVIDCLFHCEDAMATALLSNRDAGDGFFENRWVNIEYFDVTYTAGRRKKTEDGFEAKAAREVLLMTKYWKHFVPEGGANEN